MTSPDTPCMKRPLTRRLTLWLGMAALALVPAAAVVLGIIWRAPSPHDVPAEKPPSWFRDVTETTGVEFVYRNGEEAGHLTILESLGGGVALLDYDGDGLLDIFLTGGGTFDRQRDD